MERDEGYEKAANLLIDSAKLSVGMSGIPLALLAANISRMSGAESVLFKLTLTICVLLFIFSALVSLMFLYLSRVLVARNIYGDATPGRPGEHIFKMLEKYGTASESGLVELNQKMLLPVTASMLVGWFLFLVIGLCYIWG
jgi:preprotein translocase subunit SecG